jgi:hypothetical protein
MSQRILAGLAVLLLVACDGSVGGGNGNGDGGTSRVIDGGSPAGAPDAAVGVVVGGDAGTWTCYPSVCGGHSLQCNDCIDNDGDGEVDSHDRECLGPCDNSEGPALSGGIGGETGGPCKADCYFDFGNGSGGDDCHWDHRCDPLEVSPDYPPEGDNCAYDESRLGSNECPAVQSDQCHDFCRPLTPNGCDCFGCCTFPELNGGYVWLGKLDHGVGTCTFDSITDASKCPPCTPVEDCSNDCRPCEVCIGAPPPPPSCFEGDAGTNQQCPGGEQPCGLPGQAECAAGAYCISGCCQNQIGKR